jgi:hypothetical protein
MKISLQLYSASSSGKVITRWQSSGLETESWFDQDYVISFQLFQNC